MVGTHFTDTENNDGPHAEKEDAYKDERKDQMEEQRLANILEHLPSIKVLSGKLITSKFHMNSFKKPLGMNTLATLDSCKRTLVLINNYNQQIFGNFDMVHVNDIKGGTKDDAKKLSADGTHEDPLTPAMLEVLMESLSALYVPLEDDTAKEDLPKSVKPDNDVFKCFDLGRFRVAHQTQLLAPYLTNIYRVREVITRNHNVEEQMVYEALRLTSFRGIHIESSVMLLAATGFYATGNRDETRCFSCGVTHRNWTHTDNPVTVHSQTCIHVAGTDERNVPIQNISMADDYTENDISIRERDRDPEDVGVPSDSPVSPQKHTTGGHSNKDFNYPYKHLFGAVFKCNKDYLLISNVVGSFLSQQGNRKQMKHRLFNFQCCGINLKNKDFSNFSELEEISGKLEAAIQDTLFQNLKYTQHHDLVSQFRSCPEEDSLWLVLLLVSLYGICHLEGWECEILLQLCSRYSHETLKMFQLLTTRLLKRICKRNEILQLYQLILKITRLKRFCYLVEYMCCILRQLQMN